jgi:outer membrane usher protein
MMVESRQSLPTGPGLGYRMAGGSDDGESLWEGGLSLNTRTGRYGTSADHDERGTVWRASAAGAAAWIGGMPFLTREVRDAFAVVKVNGFEGVNVFLENQPVGRTDSSGRILIPGLRPFEQNRVRIEMEDLPLTARIDDVEKIVTPYAGAGALADFPVSEGKDALLRLLLPDGNPAVQGAYVILNEQGLRYPVGIDGAVYLRDVEDGDRAVMHYRDQRCGFTVELDGRDGPVPDLGDVICGRESAP